ncbi:hypothetical protein [Halorubellus sp. PRR65]|uniref:hypothetical protein n=1 Tax=Halorubellus sp. PRR65 TaxID=3098148 RepID=UPI002B25E658|nr:hypothetical protein [Halorubellus sp. PRR65]
MTDETTSTNASTQDHDADDGTADADRDADAAERRDADRRATDREPRGRSRTGFFGGDLYERLQWLALVVLVLVAVATLFSFYTNVTRLISIWASRRYEPALQAAFALAVLATSLAGIVALSRNLR